ncbi:MAG: DUF4412 domain-containing protein [Crocinitomicaceae bacterium]|nr:DUF4412 domain-containing protein [Crocinitomicaceae bacterium]
MKIKLIFTAVLIGFTLTAQQTKGRISYDIVASSEDAQTAAFAKQMEGNSTLEIYFSDEGIRDEMYLGDFMTNISIRRKDSDTVLTLLDGMMGKVAMKSTLNDLPEEQKEAMTNRTVELVQGTKEIMGYECKKAIITTSDDNQTVVWYTPEILPAFRSGQYLMEEIPGMPLYMEGKWGNMNFQFVAFENKKKLKKPEQLFDKAIPSGYTLRSMEEMQQMRRGG